MSDAKSSEPVSSGVDALIARLREVTTANLMRIELTEQPQGLPTEDELPEMEAHHFDPLTGEDDLEEADFAFVDVGREAAGERDSADQASWGKVGRNEKCPCGSGKKYKHCHGALA